MSSPPLPDQRTSRRARRDRLAHHIGGIHVLAKSRRNAPDKFVFQQGGRALLIACSLLGCLTSFQAPAQTQSPTPANAYPTRPVHIVIPLGPGNSAEVVTRLVAQKLSIALGQPVRHRTPARGGRSDRHRARSSFSGGRLHAPRRNRWRHGGFAEFSRADCHSIRSAISCRSRRWRGFLGFSRCIAYRLVRANWVHRVDRHGEGGTRQDRLLQRRKRQRSAARDVDVHDRHRDPVPPCPIQGRAQAAMDVVSGQIPIAFAGVPIVSESSRTVGFGASRCE